MVRRVLVKHATRLDHLERKRCANDARANVRSAEKTRVGIGVASLQDCGAKEHVADETLERSALPRSQNKRDDDDDDDDDERSRAAHVARSGKAAKKQIARRGFRSLLECK